MKCYLINVKEQTVTEGTYNEGDDIRKYVGGWIELAMKMGKNVIYVNEEGFLRDDIKDLGFFWIAGLDQPFAGNGFLVGPEIDDPIESQVVTRDPTITLQELRSLVSFVTYEKVQNWAKTAGNSMTVTAFNEDGQELEVRGFNPWTDLVPEKK